MNLIAALMLAALALLAGPAAGQDTPNCNTVAEDKALVANDGVADYLGVFVLPYVEWPVVMYRMKATNTTVFSPIVRGCVDPQTYRLGPFKAREAA
jgi:hypothetical protein